MRKLLGVSLIVLLSACASQTTQPEVEDLAGGAGTGSGLGGSDLMGSGSGRPGYFSQLQDPNSILSQRSVFYDYDSYTVTSEYRELVLSHAKFLRDHADASVILPRKTMLEIHRLLEDSDELVTIKLYPNQVCFETLNKQFISNGF